MERAGSQRVAEHGLNRKAASCTFNGAVYVFAQTFLRFAVIVICDA